MKKIILLFLLAVKIPLFARAMGNAETQTTVPTAAPVP